VLVSTGLGYGWAIKQHSHCGCTSRLRKYTLPLLNINGHADVSGGNRRSYLTQNRATADPPPPTILGSRLSQLYLQNVF